MLLVSLVVILREVLEASVVLALLLVLARQTGASRRWVWPASALGALGAGLLASHFDTVASWQDGVGQELLNAVVYASVFIGLVWLSFTRGHPRQIQITMGAVFTLTTLREGAEVILYYSAYQHDPELLRTALHGGAMGTGIGLSLGVVCYYGLTQLSQGFARLGVQLWLALFGAGILSQSALMLEQADWLTAQAPLWRSDWLIPETSLVGQLLFALFSYEATPSAFQVMTWLVGLCLLLSLPLLPGASSRCD